MIRPTLKITLYRVVDRDVFGQPVFNNARTEYCVPIRLMFRSMNTTVRTDSSSTHGHALEGAHSVVILVPTYSLAQIDSVIEIPGFYKLRVDGRQPRYTASGKLDHFELELSPWE